MQTDSNVKDANFPIKGVAKIQGYLGLESFSPGAVLAFPFVCFNAVTTVFGAGKILPFFVGYPVGFFISIIYFLIIGGDKFKKIHPLRRLLLVAIFSSISAYSSFFSIYETMSRLDFIKKSSEPTLKAHTDFNGDAIKVIESSKSEIQRTIPTIYIDILDREKKEKDFRREIDDLNGKSPQRVAELDTSLQRNKNELDRIKSNLSSTDYENGQIKYSQYNLLHTKELELKKDTQSDVLDAYTLFSQDKTKYKEISELIKGNSKEDIPEKGSISFNEPIYDNYIGTPVFLIPWEILQANSRSRESNFLRFAIVISIFFELIPILLSGFTLRSENKYLNFRGSRIKNSQEDSVQANSSENFSVLADRYSEDLKTPISQVSGIICSVISDISQLLKEVFNTLSLTISPKITNNVRNELYAQLDQAMYAADLNSSMDKYFFLIFFYELICHDSKSISLSSFLVDNSKEDGNEYFSLESLQYKIAAGLLIDLMRSDKIRWLKSSQDLRNKPLANGPDMKTSLPGKFWSQLFLSNTSKSTSKKSYRIQYTSRSFQTWTFRDNFSYQEFLDWWLASHRAQSSREIEKIFSAFNLKLYYQMRLSML